MKITESLHIYIYLKTKRVFFPICTQVYCGKVPNTVSEEELILLFEKCGTIWDLRLMLDPLTGQGRGFCFCTFTDKQGAEQAVKQVSCSARRKFSKPVNIQFVLPVLTDIFVN